MNNLTIYSPSLSLAPKITHPQCVWWWAYSIRQRMIINGISLNEVQCWYHQLVQQWPWKCTPTHEADDMR